MGITMRRYLIALSAVCIAAFGLGACSSGDSESLTFDVAIEDRSVVGGHTTFEAKQGDSVTFNLTADEAGEFHLHGYDLRAESEAGGVGGGRAGDDRAHGGRDGQLPHHDAPR